ncbi:MAG: LysR substrate-binding domain-containing protein, partial [Paracoccaceae bacterium]
RLSASEPAAYVASPDYLHRHGLPQRPDDLLHHRCILHRQISGRQITEWRFDGPDGDVVAEVTGSLIVNDLRSVVDAARSGFGIGWSLYRGVADDIERGNLIQVLAACTPARPGFFLYFPKSLQQFGPLRCFIDHFRHRDPPR